MTAMIGQEDPLSIPCVKMKQRNLYGLKKNLEKITEGKEGGYDCRYFIGPKKTEHSAGYGVT